jgi:hypothetical protein
MDQKQIAGFISEVLQNYMQRILQTKLMQQLEDHPSDFAVLLP